VQAYRIQEFETLERETGIEPATFSLGSGVGFILSGTYPAFFEIHEPIETALCQAGKNLDQIWTKVLLLAERCAPHLADNPAASVLRGSMRSER
jgi:hypothetical protein